MKLCKCFTWEHDLKWKEIYDIFWKMAKKLGLGPWVLKLINSKEENYMFWNEIYETKSFDKTMRIG